MVKANRIPQLLEALANENERHPASECGLFPEDEKKPTLWESIVYTTRMILFIAIGTYVLMILFSIVFVLHIYDEIKAGFAVPTKRYRFRATGNYSRVLAKHSDLSDEY